MASEKNHKVFYGNQSIRGFFDFKFSFHNCFWNLSSTSGLSQICKLRNAFHVRSQGILLSEALKRLLGVEKHYFGKKIVQLIQKW
jgi:hypothetical protein